MLINDRKIYGLGNSHSELAEAKKVKEDDYLKVNIIYDGTRKEGYRMEVDEHSKEQINHYKKQGFLKRDGSIISSYIKRMDKYCKENLAEIFKTLCKNLQSASIKGYQSNDSAVIEGYQSNSSASIKEYQSNYSATIKENQSNDSAVIEGYQSNSSANIKEYQSNHSANIKGYQSNDSANIKGYQSNYSATIQGNQSNHSAVIEGYQYNNSAVIKVDIILYKTVIGDKNSETTKLITEFSKSVKSWKEATLTNFIKFIQNKSKKRR